MCICTSRRPIAPDRASISTSACSRALCSFRGCFQDAVEPRELVRHVGQGQVAIGCLQQHVAHPVELPLVHEVAAQLGERAGSLRVDGEPPPVEEHRAQAFGLDEVVRAHEVAQHPEEHLVALTVRLHQLGPAQPRALEVLRIALHGRPLEEVVARGEQGVVVRRDAVEDAVEYLVGLLEAGALHRLHCGPVEHGLPIVGPAPEQLLVLLRGQRRTGPSARNPSA